VGSTASAGDKGRRLRLRHTLTAISKQAVIAATSSISRTRGRTWLERDAPADDGRHPVDIRKGTEACRVDLLDVVEIQEHGSLRSQ
jgi:hypothetical protein